MMIKSGEKKLGVSGTAQSLSTTSASYCACVLLQPPPRAPVLLSAGQSTFPTVSIQSPFLGTLAHPGEGDRAVIVWEGIASAWFLCEEPRDVSLLRNLVSPASTTRYKNQLSSARAYELARHDVILCTCSAASATPLEHLNVKQIIIDECAMSTEPETLIPLVSHRRAEKVSPFQRCVSGTAAQGSRTSACLSPLTVLLFQVLPGFKVVLGTTYDGVSMFQPSGSCFP